MAMIGVGAIVILSMLASHYIASNPALRPMLDLRALMRQTYGDRIVRLHWAPDQLGSALRVVYRPERGPTAKPLERQAREMGGFVLSNWSGTQRLSYVEVRGVLEPEDRWQRVEQEFRHRGYLDVKIDPQAQFNDAAATVSYRVAITQGPQYRMRNLILTGLSPEAADAVRLRWELRSGQIADGVYIDEMLAKLEQPSREIFGNRPVHYAELGSWLRTDPESQTIDVLLDFQ